MSGETDLPLETGGAFGHPAPDADALIRTALTDALDAVDFACLNQRLRQNGAQEKLAALWIDRSLRKLGARP